MLSSPGAIETFAWTMDRGTMSEVPSSRPPTPNAGSFEVGDLPCYPLRASSRLPKSLRPLAIGAAYFFTSSTSFANPANTVGRIFSNTFAGMAPSSAPVYIGAQVMGAGAAVLVIETLHPDVAHDDRQS